MIIKKNVIAIFFLFIFVIAKVSVLFGSVSELYTHFSRINGFYATFIQKIFDSTGNLIQESIGELWIQKSNCFKYHIISPEEIFLISNGKILWFYDPVLNQVSISWLKDVLDNTFLSLFCDNLQSDWNSKYYIKENNNTLFLFPKENRNIFFKQIIIQINSQGAIKKIEFLNNENHNIVYQLTSYNKGLFNIDIFNFLPPNNVKIDEQRR